MLFLYLSMGLLRSIKRCQTVHFRGKNETVTFVCIILSGQFRDCSLLRRLQRIGAFIVQVSVQGMSYCEVSILLLVRNNPKWPKTRQGAICHQKCSHSWRLAIDQVEAHPPTLCMFGQKVTLLCFVWSSYQMRPFKFYLENFFSVQTVYRPLWLWDSEPPWMNHVDPFFCKHLIQKIHGIKSDLIWHWWM